MSIRNIVAVFAVATLGAPLLADIPDGRGGRTSPQASRRAATTPAHACCPRTTVSTQPQPISAAEKKAIGEVAWNSRYGAKTAHTVACCRGACPTLVQSSQAESNAVDRTPATQRAGGTRCCGCASCPMHQAS
jgi:hypothetical protein